MKYFKFLTLVLCSLFIVFTSCKDKAETPKEAETTKEPLKVFDSPSQPNATTTEAAQSPTGVWHYTCNNGCAGGSGAAGNCSTCGNPLAHNQAYHANTTNTTNNPTTPPVTPPVEPSQNTAGIWHYTCGNGCAGGAGSAGTCGTCGGTLAHNTAYHQ